MENFEFNNISCTILSEHEKFIEVFINVSNLPDRNILISLAREVNNKKRTLKDVFFATRPKDEDPDDKTTNEKHTVQTTTVLIKEINNQ